MATLGERAGDWIEEACRRFATATGTPLEFVPCVASEAELLQRSWETTYPRRWHERIAADGEVVGLMYGDLEGSGAAEGSEIAKVAEMAQLVSGLVGRVVTASTALESRTRDLSTLVEIGRDLPQQGDLGLAIRSLLRAALDLTPFRGAAFFLVDPSTRSLQLRVEESDAEFDVPFPRRSLEQARLDLAAIEDGELLLERGTDEEVDRWLPTNARTAVAFAVHTEDGPVGTLWLFDRRARQPSRREWHVLRSIVAQFTSVLERAVLRQENMDQSRLQRELESVRGSQVFDFPRLAPQSAGYEIAAACTSQHEVGGDLCEVLPLDDHRAIVAVGDACGNSVPAALVMAAVRGTIRGIHGLAGSEPLCPPEAVALVNRVLCEVSPPHQFMSLFFGLVDTENMMLTYTNAGHPGPLRFRGESFEECGSHGLLLGILPDTEYGHETVRLHSGELLVAYSDGVTEVMRKGGRQMFRRDGLAEAVRERRHLPVDDVLTGIWEDVDRFGGGGVADDRTLLVLRVK